MSKTTEKSRYTTTAVIQVWDDVSGDRLEVREDGDGLGLVTLCNIDSDGVTVPDIVATPEQMLVFAEALTAYCKQVLSRQPTS